jgi:hypothetical protein
MGTFNQLPNDVKWLIFRLIAMDAIKTRGYPPHFFSEGHEHANLFNLTYITEPMIDLALVSKSCLKVIRSKCYKCFDGRLDGWLFRRGALDDNTSIFKIFLTRKRGVMSATTANQVVIASDGRLLTLKEFLHEFDTNGETDLNQSTTSVVHSGFVPPS